jgi:2-polyprenyl-3-methyl-5-hydroxy-6-metoxy-1,4-benzoquinol methylase
MRSSADVYLFPVDPNSDTAPANVLRFVGCEKTVLEIGAGPGSIARPLVERNRNRVTAIEIDAASIGILEEFCESVIRADLNANTWPSLLLGRQFDAVVIADVLEHLYDPWTTLRLASELLVESGSVVVSLPHASHAAILGCLMNNDFEYRDCGLLDRTHIRFFSIRNIQALFDGAGLKIVDFAYVLQHPEETEFAQTWRALPARTRATLEANEFAHVYQVVVRAIPADGCANLPGYFLPARKPPRANKLKFIAFYLPQYHPIPENDAWWGKGFTEWSNTSRAKPLFPGHYQPHEPADFGYYDLRVRDVQREQIDYASRFGIDAFCFHFYWFGGHRLLERPLEDFLADTNADIEFCLCWANENWTRRWDAAEHEVLIEQTYSPKNDIDLIEDLLPYFRDPRYLRVKGAPVLIVYRPQQIPDVASTVRRWRQYCRANGIGEIHLVAALTHGNDDFEVFGFDAGVEFPPHNIHTQNLRDKVGADRELTGLITSYGDVARTCLNRDYSQRQVYRTVFPSWDNTARIGERAIVVLDSTPENYERWLAEAAFSTIADRAPGERLLFINAWNEWAEGCHLEPDKKFGTRFLEATLRVKSGESRAETVFPPVVLPEPEPELTAEPQAEPETRVEVVSLGLRTELGRWGVRTLDRYPILYRGGRAFYRFLIKWP